MRGRTVHRLAHDHLNAVIDGTVGEQYVGCFLRLSLWSQRGQADREFIQLLRDSGFHTHPDDHRAEVIDGETVGIESNGFSATLSSPLLTSK